MKSYISSSNGAGGSTSAVNYGVFASGLIAFSTTQTDIEQVISHDLTIDRLMVYLATAPGSGKSWEFTLMKNGSATGLTCTISDAATTGQDVSNSVSFSAGDTVSMRSTPSGTPTATGRIQWTARQESSGTQALITGTNNTALGTTTQFINADHSPVSTGTQVNIQSPIPCDGTISHMYTILTVAPGVGNSRLTALMVNGSASALSVTISDANTTGNDTSNSVSVSAGDLVSVRSTVTGTPGGSRISVGMKFTPNNDGDSILLSSSNDNPSTTVTEYKSSIADDAWVATESIARQHRFQDATIRSLYIKNVSAPTAGKSFQYDVRKNSADSGLSATVSDADTTANASSSFSVSDGDLLGMESTPSGTPTTSRVGTGILYTGGGGAATVVKDIISMGIIPFAR